MATGSEEVIGRADLIEIHDIPVLLGQRKSERGMVGVMGHAWKVGLPQVVNLSFDD
jgi:hypothetical protein